MATAIQSKEPSNPHKTCTELLNRVICAVRVY